MLSRNRSVKNLYKTTEAAQNVQLSLNQKDKIISMLRAEIQSHSSLHEKITRLKEKKNSILDKCDVVIAEISRGKELQSSREQKDYLKLGEISNTVKALEKQIKDKQYYLKELRHEGNRLAFENQNREHDLDEFCGDIENNKNSMGMIQLQKQRIQDQIDFIREEIQKLHSYQTKTLQSIEKIKEQSYESETYIRTLRVQEQEQTQNLNIIEGESEQAEEILDDLAKLQQESRNKIRQITQDNSEITTSVKTKELEQGRVETQKSEVLARIRHEEQRARTLTEQLSKKQAEINNLSSMLRNEVKPDILETTNKNGEIYEINSQLRNDLDDCVHHLENLERANKSLSEELDKIEKNTFHIIKFLTNVCSNTKVNRQQRCMKIQNRCQRQPLGAIENTRSHTHRTYERKPMKASDLEMFETAADQLSKPIHSRIH